MTIAERINLHRCGYSRAEIDALAKEEKEVKAAEDQAPEQDPAGETSTTQDTTATREQEPDPVLEAIKGLTAAIQASNINKTPQPETQQETVSDLLNKL